MRRALGLGLRVYLEIWLTAHINFPNIPPQCQEIQVWAHRGTGFMALPV